jgi:catalase (peroxidase I)
MVVDDGFKDSVERFADNERLFFDTFAKAYQRLVSIGTGIVD